jgi:hypothetical protein
LLGESQSAGDDLPGILPSEAFSLSECRIVGDSHTRERASRGLVSRGMTGVGKLLVAKRRAEFFL